MSRTSKNENPEHVEQPHAAMDWRAPDGRVIDRPLEWQPAAAVLDPQPAALGELSATVNGQPVSLSVKVVAGAPRVVLDWPRSGPGCYELVVSQRGDVQHHRFVIQPSKISREQMGQLIDDLETRLPTLVALGIQKAGGLAGYTLQSPNQNTLAQELARLERAVLGNSQRPGLAAVLNRLSDRYREQLSSESRWSRRERVRRVTPSGLVATIRRPNNFDHDRRPQRVLESIVNQTPDIYENQLVKLFTRRVTAGLRSLGSRFAGQSSEPACRVAQLVAIMEQATAAATFLEEVTLPRTPPRRLTMVLMRVPEYRAALEGLLEFQRNLRIQLDEDRLLAPLDNLPMLYQRWCTLHVISALLEVAHDAGYQLERQSLVRPADGFGFVRVLPNGHEALRLRHPVNQDVLRLVPERTFGATGPLRSASFPQRPDITIERRFPDGRVELLLLDPKYKLDSGGDEAGKPIKADIDKMHAYRDAIRTAEGRKIVRFAAILYPGSDQAFGRHLAAIGFAPGKPGLSTFRCVLWPWLKAGSRVGDCR